MAPGTLLILATAACGCVRAADHSYSSSDNSNKEIILKWCFRSAALLLFVLFCVGVIRVLKRIISSKLSRKPLCSRRSRRASSAPLAYEEPAWLTRTIAFISFKRQILEAYVSSKLSVPPVSKERNRKGYGELYDAFTLLFRFGLRKYKDCWGRPICSTPGTEVTLMERVTRDKGWTFEFTGETKTCINLGSFNYMGFADSTGSCARSAQVAILRYGVAMGSSRRELGTTRVVEELESSIARFLGVEAAVVFGMGFSANASNLPCLLRKGCLAVSDERNHSSLVTGMRTSGATVQVFKHNNMESLEKTLREAVIYGQPRTHRPWKKIFIVVEGIYSVDGTIVNLASIVALKKKYKAYIFIDEAHSIGAIGCGGRGAVGYHGVDPKDVDVHMGTLSKAFGSVGAYIAGTKKLVDFLRVNSPALCYETAMAPAIAQQSLSAVGVMLGEDGTETGKTKVKQLAENVRFFRSRLREMGVIVLGSDDSPVVPVLVVNLLKLGAAVRQLRDMGVAVVAVCFPATPLYKCRLRFCLSAGHTRQQLEKVLFAMDIISGRVGFKDSRRSKLRQKGDVESVSY